MRPVRRKKRASVSNRSIMDYIIMGTGAAVILIAFVLGILFLGKNTKEDGAENLLAVGAQLSDISLIGEKGLLAVADAERAKLEAALILKEQEEQKQEEDKKSGYEETDYKKAITVTLNLTSVQKDLKVKFINKETKKLIANVPFSVTVKKPDGKSEIWSDDDMDGIIYKKGIASGAYTITANALTEERYKDYALPDDNQMVNVKKDISYKKIDVSDEIKEESEIDAKKEDTKVNDTEVESFLKDTVAWVESTSVIETYTEVSKSKIQDPLLIDLTAKEFKKTAYVGTINPATSTIKVGKTLELTSNPAVDLGAGATVLSVTWSSDKNDVATVAGNGTAATVTAVAPGVATISYSAQVQITKTIAPTTGEGAGAGTGAGTGTGEGTGVDEEAGTGEGAATGAETGAGESGEPTTIIETVTGTCTVTVEAADSKGTVTFTEKAAELVIGGTCTITPKVEGFTSGKQLKYGLSGNDTAVATATVDAAGKITITGVSKGDTALALTVNYEGGSDETKVTVNLPIKVTEKKTIKLSLSQVALYVEGKATLTAEITNGTGSGSLKAEASEAGVVKLEVKDKTVTIIGEKAGSATVTVSYEESGEKVSEKCIVKINTNPKNDKVTLLQDAEKHQLYVLENGKYREAVYADYYTADKFFAKGDAKYTGWQTLNGHVYFFTAAGDKVTGEQVIQGAKYVFASDGSLVTGSGTMGIDVSKWNGNIDWTAVKNSGVSYVIIRCGYRGSSQGMLVEDPKFQANIKGATDAGLKVGVYFFTQAIDEVEAVYEASFVIDKIKKYKISYPVFLDVESSGGRGDNIDKSMRTKVCKAFCETIQGAGYTAGIYANKTWLEKRIDADALKGYKIWLAQYAEKPTYTGHYDLWQYKSTGRISGISGDVDMNISYLGY